MIVNIPKGFGILVLVANNLIFILQLRSNWLFSVFIKWMTLME
jgi:hypothetical protein